MERISKSLKGNFSKISMGGKSLFGKAKTDIKSFKGKALKVLAENPELISGAAGVIGFAALAVTLATGGNDVGAYTTAASFFTALGAPVASGVVTAKKMNNKSRE